MSRLVIKLEVHSQVMSRAARRGGEPPRVDAADRTRHGHRRRGTPSPRDGGNHRYRLGAARMAMLCRTRYSRIARVRRRRLNDGRSELRCGPAVGSARAWSRGHDSELLASQVMQCALCGRHLAGRRQWCCSMEPRSLRPPRRLSWWGWAPAGRRSASHRGIGSAVRAQRASR